MRQPFPIAPLLLLAIVEPALAQTVPLHRAVDAAILSDVARDRQAEREAKRQPYASDDYGPIHSAAAGRDARILGRPSASTMSTGWEVEGEVGPYGDRPSVPFVCSVRNGSVSGILLRP